MSVDWYPIEKRDMAKCLKICDEHYVVIPFKEGEKSVVVQREEGDNCPYVILSWNEQQELDRVLMGKGHLGPGSWVLAEEIMTRIKVRLVSDIAISEYHAVTKQYDMNFEDVWWWEEQARMEEYLKKKEEEEA